MHITCVSVNCNPSVNLLTHIFIPALHLSVDFAVQLIICADLFQLHIHVEGQVETEMLLLQ